ncbi:MAG: nucleotidyltransferase family protein [Hydrogenobaculum sp.]
MEKIAKQSLKNKVLELLKSHKDELYEKFGVLHVGLFGSVAREEEKENSDIDIYVEIDYSRISIDGYLALFDYLEKTLKTRVDIITSNQLKHMRNLHKKIIIQNEIIYVF